MAHVTNAQPSYQLLHQQIVACLVPNFGYGITKEMIVPWYMSPILSAKGGGIHLKMSTYGKL